MKDDELEMRLRAAAEYLGDGHIPLDVIEVALDKIIAEHEGGEDDEG